MENIKANISKVMIVILVFNHAARLRDVIKKSLKIHSNVMVIDDGSTDLTPEILSDLDIIFLRHSKNLGKGAAILTASNVPEHSKFGRKF